MQSVGIPITRCHSLQVACHRLQPSFLGRPLLNRLQRRDDGPQDAPLNAAVVLRMRLSMNKQQLRQQVISQLFRGVGCVRCD